MTAVKRTVPGKAFYTSGTLSERMQFVHPHKVSLDYFSRGARAHEWCKQQFGPPSSFFADGYTDVERWADASHVTFYFTDLADAALFKLMWT